MPTDMEVILKLTSDLRRMDQYIYRMMQSTSLDQLRSILNEANVETSARMQEESRRIQAVLIPEVVRTYATHQAPPAPGHPRLEGPRDAGGEDGET